MSRLEWALGIVLVLLLIVVIVLSVMFWFQPEPFQASPADTAATAVAQRAHQIAPTSVFEGRTAKISYAKALKTAVAWQADAQLSAVNATWPQGTDRRTLLTGETTWNYIFYSPSKGANATIAVTEDTAALISDAAASGAPIPDVTSWDLDSKDAMALFMNAGGDEFLESQGITTLTMILNSNEVDGRLEWLILLFAPANGNALTTKIDATSGQIISQ
ncbi:MAG: hypothetical protein ACE5EY_05480 [Anaerolineae bacterium]